MGNSASKRQESSQSVDEKLHQFMTRAAADRDKVVSLTKKLFQYERLVSDLTKITVDNPHLKEKLRLFKVELNNVTERHTAESDISAIPTGGLVAAAAQFESNARRMRDEFKQQKQEADAALLMVQNTLRLLLQFNDGKDRGLSTLMEQIVIFLDASSQANFTNAHDIANVSISSIFKRLLEGTNGRIKGTSDEDTVNDITNVTDATTNGVTVTQVAMASIISLGSSDPLPGSSVSSPKHLMAEFSSDTLHHHPLKLQRTLLIYSSKEFICQYCQLTKKTHDFVYHCHQSCKFDLCVDCVVYAQLMLGIETVETRASYAPITVKIKLGADYCESMVRLPASVHEHKSCSELVHVTLKWLNTVDGWQITDDPTNFGLFDSMDNRLDEKYDAFDQCISAPLLLRAINNHPIKSSWLNKIDRSINKFAFVAGFSKYENGIAALQSCEVDAEQMAKELSDLGYDIYNNGPLYNCSHHEFNEEFTKFLAQARARGQRTQVVLYISGHGHQNINGCHFILPIDVREVRNASGNKMLVTDVTKDKSLLSPEYESSFICSKYMVQEIEKLVPEGLCLAFIDSCRKNRVMGAGDDDEKLFQDESDTPVEGVVGCPSGIIKIHSCGPGQPSFTGTGTNEPSLFTSYLLSVMHKQNISLLASFSEMEQAYAGSSQAAGTHVKSIMAEEMEFDVKTGITTRRMGSTEELTPTISLKSKPTVSAFFNLVLNDNLFHKHVPGCNIPFRLEVNQLILRQYPSSVRWHTNDLPVIKLNFPLIILRSEKEWCARVLDTDLYLTSRTQVRKVAYQYFTVDAKTTSNENPEPLNMTILTTIDDYPLDPFTAYPACVSPPVTPEPRFSYLEIRSQTGDQRYLEIVKVHRDKLARLGGYWIMVYSPCHKTSGYMHSKYLPRRLQQTILPEP